MQEGEPPLAKSRTRGACLSGVSDKVVVVLVVVVVQGKIPDLARFAWQTVDGRWTSQKKKSLVLFCFVFPIPHPSSSLCRNWIS